MNNEQIYLNQEEEIGRLKELQKEMGLKLLNPPMLDNDLIQNEAKVYDFNRKIRQSWRQKVGIMTAPLYKSTLWNTEVKDMQNFTYSYSYETLLNDESKFPDKLGYNIKNMKSKTFLFSSGMSAISNILYCFSSFVRGSLNVQASIGYFETKYFFKILSSMGNDVNFDIDSDINANTFYFEPIKYDSTLSVTDINSLIESINKSQSDIKFVIMDSTMHNRTSILSKISERINNINNIILCDVRSGLKLDQEGLELSNIGICTIFISNKNLKLFEAVKNYIEQYKSLTGTNISFQSIALSHYFDAKNNSLEYVEKVKNQVIWANDCLNAAHSKKIKRILCRKIKLYGDILITPFIFIELCSKREESYLQSIHKIQDSMEKLGTPIDYRNSWGFRMPSIEYFDDIFSNQKFIKFYPGMFKGLTAINALYVLQNL